MDEPGTDATLKGARLAVLVVEDEAIIRLDLATALAEEGFEVSEAADASAALELFRANPQIEAVIAAIGLPGEMSGFDLIQVIRRERPSCTVILATAKELRIPDEFDEHILLEQKPYDPAKIGHILRMRFADHI